MKLTGWAYPEGQKFCPSSLSDTIFTQLPRLHALINKRKTFLLGKGIILCNDIPQYQMDLARMGFSMHDAAAIIAEAQGVMELKPHLD